MENVDVETLQKWLFIGFGATADTRSAPCSPEASRTPSACDGLSAPSAL